VLVPLLSVIASLIGLVRDRDREQARTGLLVGGVALAICLYSALAYCA